MAPVTETSTALRFSDMRRKTVKVATNELVAETPLMSDRSSLLTIDPREASLDFVEWAGEAKPSLAELLLKHRGILFRNFGVKSPERFHKDGDVLLLDNMTMAHRRQPYRDTRKVIVAMVEPYNDPNNIR
jgi:hypothetical protein